MSNLRTNWMMCQNTRTNIFWRGHEVLGSPVSQEAAVVLESGLERTVLEGDALEIAEHLQLVVDIIRAQHSLNTHNHQTKK